MSANNYMRIFCTERTVASFLEFTDPGLPAPTLRWKWRPRSCTPNESLQDKSLEQKVWKSLATEDSILVIHTLQSRDDGFYACEAQNGMGQSMSPPLSIEVKVPAKIVKQPKPPEREIVGEYPVVSSRIRCVARGKPAPTIVWKHNGRLISSPSTDNGMAQNSSPIRISISHQCVQLSHDEFIWETSSELSWTELNRTRTDARAHKWLHRASPDSDIEGAYVCEAANILGTTSSAKVRISRRYVPQCMHEKQISQAFTGHVDWSLFEARPSTELLNDPPPAASSGFVGQMTSTGAAVYCLMRSNPAPTKLSWYYVKQSSQCRLIIAGTNKTDCGCSEDTLLAIAGNDQQTPMVRKSSAYRARIITGNEAGQFITSVVGRNPGIDEDTAVVAQLLFNAENTPQLGSYAAWLTNSLGCEMCLVHLQNPSPPEDIAQFQVENITWSAILLTWQTGFDGGFTQTVILERLKVDDAQTPSPSWKYPSNPIRKRFEIQNIPKLPTSYRCWFTNLEPSTQYQFVLYTENKLGRNKHTRTVDIKTVSLDFPQLERMDTNMDYLELYFTDPEQLAHFCVQIEVSHPSPRNWFEFYSDCPRADDSTKPSPETQKDPLTSNTGWVCHTAVSSNPNWFWYTMSNGSHSSPVTDDLGATYFAPVTMDDRTHVKRPNPLKVKRTSLYVSDRNNASEPLDSFGHLSGSVIQYRIRTCLLENGKICSPNTMFETGMLTSIQEIRTATLKPSAEEEFKLLEVPKSSTHQSWSDAGPACDGAHSCCMKNQYINPPITSDFASASGSVPALPQPLDVINNISKTTPLCAVTSCSILLNSAAVGPDSQVLSPVFSVASPSDLIRDVEIIGTKRIHNPTSPVLLIPAAQLSTVEFSTKPVYDEDPVSLILHIPVQSASST
ncbi:hypothetical protein D915_003793 [Fasciola hepatica]|uniref:Immunoglobulin I-set domain protein n=1 Tax=Fasciola hepatica TaxID=6192 RepID=A0A4E0RVA8_FASHE|nr:hypothetical protein D915_003793 [Fasciola hepatica]